MIDPLLNNAMPQPGRASGQQEMVAGAPSFLPWAKPGQRDGSPQHDKPLAPEQNAVPGMPVPPVPTGSGSGVIDPRHVVEDRVPDPVVGDPFVLPASFGSGSNQASGEISGMTTGQTSGTAEMSAAAPGHVGGLTPLLDSTGMVLDATRWRDFLSATLELHVRNPQGDREVVAMPWRLVATGHLAHADGLAWMGRSIPAAAASGATQVSSTQSVASLRTTFPVVNAMQWAVYDSNGILVSAPQSRASNRLRDDAAPQHATSAHAPAAAEWLARWMKWIERDGRDVVVWLRDFSIDEDQTSRVVDGLRSFAQSQGVSLERIVINGRELWRNPQLAVFSESKE